MRSPLNHVFSGAHSSYLMHDRVVSFVFTWTTGSFLFCASAGSSALQINTTGAVHTLGIGTGGVGWDTVQQVTSTATAGRRQVLTFLVKSGNPRSLILRCAGNTVGVNPTITWTTSAVPLAPFTSLLLGGRTEPGTDGDVILHEVFISSSTQVPATLQGVNDEYTRLCIKWGVNRVPNGATLWFSADTLLSTYAADTDVLSWCDGINSVIAAGRALGTGTYPRMKLNEEFPYVRIGTGTSTHLSGGYLDLESGVSVFTQGRPPWIADMEHGVGHSGRSDYHCMCPRLGIRWLRPRYQSVVRSFAGGARGTGCSGYVLVV